MAVSHSTWGPALRAGIDAFFGNRYMRHKQFWESWYTKVTTEKSWYEMLSRSGFSTLEERAIGGTTSSEDPGLGYLVQIRPLSYGKKFAVYDETKDDDINGSIKDFIGDMWEAVAETENVLAHVPFNDGGSVNGYDGVPLWSNSHPQIGGGTFDNLITAADPSLDLLESFHVAIANATDDSGKQAVLRPKELVCATQQEWTWREILGSAYKPDAMNNTMNPAQGFVKLTPTPYLTDTDQTIVITDCPKGGICVKRKKPYLLFDFDKDTLANVTWCHMRIVFSYGNPRWSYASLGA